MVVACGSVPEDAEQVGGDRAEGGGWAGPVLGGLAPRPGQVQLGWGAGGELCCV